jgi:phage I-like protein
MGGMHTPPLAALSAVSFAPLAAGPSQGERGGCHLAACALRVRPGERVIRLMPAGEFNAPRGALAGAGPWRLTPAAAERVIAANRARSADILIDFEHQALLAEINGRPVPAAGWIDPRSLEYRAEGDEPGLYGAVTWAGDTAALIERDEYRYLSPVFPYDDNGEPLDLLHVALTNFPAIDEPLFAALSARYRIPPPPDQEEPQMELLKKLLAALGLPEATSEDDALAGVAALKAKADRAEAQVAALKTAPAVPDPTKFVPMATFEAERAERVRLAALAATNEVETLVEGAIADGCLLEAQREYACGLGKADLAALKGMIEAGRPIAALRGMQTGGRKPAGAGGDASATENELAVCRALGLSAEEFAKGKLNREGR